MQLGIVRLGLLVLLLGSLALFAKFNWVALPLVFLGVPLPPLPLAVWLLGALGAGAATSLAIQILVQLTSFTAARQVRKSYQQANPRTATERQGRSLFGLGRQPPEPEEDAPWTNWSDPLEPRDSDRISSGRAAGTSSNSFAERPSGSRPGDPELDDEDDWERPPSEDWEGPTRFKRARTIPNPNYPQSFGQSSGAGAAKSPATARPADPDPGPPLNIPSQRYPSGGNPPAGDNRPRPPSVPPRPSRDVVDADYRVIVPPSTAYPPSDRPVPPPQPPASRSNDDDWGDLDSDEFI